MTTTTTSISRLITTTDVSDFNNFEERLSQEIITGRERNENGQTFLMAACAEGREDIVNALLDTEVNVDAVDYDDWSALHYACKSGHVAIIEILLGKCASKQQRDVGGWTPLVWCCYKGHLDAAELLLDSGADVNVRGDHHMSCLIWAAGRGHIDVVRLLLDRGAKINTTDRYGTTALIWACRRGHYRIVRMLLDAGAIVDTSGMYSWTALIAASKAGFADCVQVLLDHSPHVNAVDKEGCTALLYACHGGYEDCVQILVEGGSYVNLTDKNGDSIFHHAVKSGKFEIVRMLLKKYADVNVQGSDAKTALYCAIEKGYYSVVRLILEHHPDLELGNKDGDTPLMKAVRLRHADIVEVLLEKGAKVSATDKKDDTCLHIALRNRARKISELLLKNPKNSRLLYRPNKAGETPYMIDSNHPKSILTQIFGARHLNASEANENRLGYDLYSSTIADVLSEPTLCTPINVGLYAKWGSGKSFLLDKLKNEMCLFEHDRAVVMFQITPLVVLVNFLVSVLGATPIGFAAGYQAGIGVAGGLMILLLIVQGIIWYGASVKEWEMAYKASTKLYKEISNFKLFLSVIFCNPPEVDKESSSVQFIFASYNKLTSFSGEQSIAMMVSSLAEEIEKEVGVITARLFHVFNSTKRKSTSRKYHSLCCIPTFVLVIIFTLCCVAVTVLLCIYPLHDLLNQNQTVFSVIVTLAILVGLALIVNLRTWCGAVLALARPQKRRVLRAVQKMKSDSVAKLIDVLKREVAILTQMVRCMNGFTKSQYRLVVFIDGLDSSEQEKLIQVLDMVSVLFSEIDSPFMTILAVDPHIIIKGIEQNLPSLFRDSNINGHDYLRNIVHLPVFLQNQGLPPAILQQQREQYHRSTGEIHAQTHSKESPPKILLTSPNEAGMMDDASSSRGSHGCRRRSSTMSSVFHFQRQESFMSNSSLDHGSHSRGKKRAMVDSPRVFGSSTVPFFQSTSDLSRTLMKSDYFSDLNPRTMRRLMNIVAVTARLLRAYGIEYSWHRLATWVNLTEQWPYRCSWVILYFEDMEELDDSISLKEIYQRVVSRIPSNREIEPLLDIDRNVKKFDAFINSMNPALQVSDMRKFLASCINVDPFLRKRIRVTSMKKILCGVLQTSDIKQCLFEIDLLPEFMQTYDSQVVDMNMLGRIPHTPNDTPGIDIRHRPVQVSHEPQISPHRFPYFPSYPNAPNMSAIRTAAATFSPFSPQPQPVQRAQKKIYVKGPLPSTPLGAMDIQAVRALLTGLVGIGPHSLTKYTDNLTKHNINGFVLENCELDELKPVLEMNFGDWQLFKALLQGLRSRELGHEGEYQILEAETGKDKTDSARARPQERRTQQPLVVALPLAKKRNSSVAKMVHLENSWLNEVIDEFSEGNDDENDSTDEDEGLVMNHVEPLPETSVRNDSPRNENRNNLRRGHTMREVSENSSSEEEAARAPIHTGLKKKVTKLIQRGDTYEILPTGEDVPMKTLTSGRFISVTKVDEPTIVDYRHSDDEYGSRDDIIIDIDHERGANC